MKKSLLVLSLLAASSTAYADDKKAWQTSTELGLISTSGNTETSSVKAKIDAKQDLDKWRNQYILSALYNQNEALSGDNAGNKETTAQRWFASVQSDYKLDSEHQGFFIFASYEKDRFSGFDYQGTLAIGYSDRWFETPKSHFDYSVGPGVAFNKTESVGGVSGVSDETAIIRVAADYLYNISENAKFTQTFSSDVAVESDQNTRSRSETAISANINSTLALKASFTMTHNSEAPVGKEDLDTQTAITLVYSL